MSKRLRSSEVCADCSAQGRQRRRPETRRRHRGGRASPSPSSQPGLPPLRRSGGAGRWRPGGGKRGGSVGPGTPGRQGPLSAAPAPSAGGGGDSGAFPGVSPPGSGPRQREAGFGRVLSGFVRIGLFVEKPVSRRAALPSARSAEEQKSARVAQQR